MDRETELIEQAMAGDSAAIEQLLLLNYDRVLKHIAARIPQKMSSYLHPEDVLQQTFLKAFRSIGSFEPKSEHSFYAWLKTIAKRQMLDEIRRFEKDPMGPTAQRSAPRSSGASSTILGMSRFLEDDGLLPGEEANRQELLRATQVALAALEPRYQDAIRLRYLMNYSKEQVAEEMGIGVDALRGILFRARQKLKKEIGRLSAYI
ncbi:sigma-70 family RNA polymerase sigma factor [Pirellulales bacterium]|nr:sigma-70 family RNA polymerase sigma factor [Pirellulales bacterium]